MKYGFTDTQWQSAIAETTTILRQCAGSHPGTITYSDLAGRLTTIRIGYHDPAMDYLLLRVSTEEYESGRGLLSVIVVHKYGDNEPGKGFYELAESLGFDISDRQAFWISELNKVLDFWRNPRHTVALGNRWSSRGRKSAE
jgi:hypothetical protein